MKTPRVYLSLQVSEESLANFRRAMRGPVITPEDEAYDSVRAVYNGMIDKRPAIIARCVDVADVISAVNFGRSQRLLVAVRGGGHNGPGLGTCEGGLVIDLSLMKSVRIDAANRTVRVDPGCTSGDVDHATSAFGLAVPFGLVASTGVAGLTLGGGIGHLTRKHGLTIDNLLEVDVVLANGIVITASATQHADLFWAVRGGGGNFGVVTSFLFRAHPVSRVYGGPIFWDARHARQVMAAYRDFLAAAPLELGSFVGLKTVPSTAPFPEEHWGKRACAVVSCFNGPVSEGEAVMARLTRTLPAPMFNWMQEHPFAVLQSLFDPMLPKGMQWYWKGDFVRTLSDEAIETHIAQAAKAPSELSLMHLYPINGAVHRVAVDETPWPVRDATWAMVIAGIDPDPAKAEALKAWGRAYWQAVRPFNMQSTYVNFMMGDESDDRVQATYGANYARLASIKAVYDPHNLFRVNQNIRPAGSGAGGLAA